MKQEVRITRIENKDDSRFGIDISLYYRKGGYNHWRDDVDRRGYVLSIVPTEHDGYFVKTRAFSGVNIFLEEVKRFSEKKLLELANSLNLNDHIHLIKQIADNEGYDIDLSSMEQGA